MTIGIGIGMEMSGRWEQQQTLSQLLCATLDVVEVLAQAQIIEYNNAREDPWSQYLSPADVRDYLISQGKDPNAPASDCDEEEFKKFVRELVSKARVKWVSQATLEDIREHKYKKRVNEILKRAGEMIRAARSS